MNKEKDALRIIDTQIYLHLELYFEQFAELNSKHLTRYQIFKCLLNVKRDVITAMAYESMFPAVIMILKMNEAKRYEMFESYYDTMYIEVLSNSFTDVLDRIYSNDDLNRLMDKE